jgi:hypothetical protein
MGQHLHQLNRQLITTSCIETVWTALKAIEMMAEAAGTMPLTLAR